MRSLPETLVRWEATFAGNASLSDLRSAVEDPTDQNPCTSGLRSICWKAFLLFENLDKSTWTKTLLDSRSAYTSLREHFLRDIEHPDETSATDPLADDETSPWHILRHDEELRAEIFQDVERCMPENLYFREPPTQKMLLDILFIYCKLNRDIGYRQGMHEVLAPVLWVVSRDAVDPTGLAAISETNAGPIDLIRAAFDSQYIEHDAFTLFGIMMQTVKTFYEIGTIEPSTTSSTPNNSPIVKRSQRIHEEHLHRADPELAEHLTIIEILPQIFLIRWIRLLFGREFPFDDVLSLWDKLFAEDPALDLVDFICVSMLLRIRWQLLDSDYSAALTLLLRYPVPADPYGPPTFVLDAMYLRRNILLDGGAHIISKYSRRSPAPPSEISASLKERGQKQPRFEKRHRLTRSLSPQTSATRFLQRQGGIEGIIQEAAKGVYSRSEKWGVRKALRDAVQGVQSSSSSPSLLSGESRRSLTDHEAKSNSLAQVTVRIHALEQRNMALAKLLENAMAELWVQQNEFAKDKADAAADALSIAIAKVQFVQVYLENPTMPIPAENAAAEDPEPELNTIKEPGVTQEIGPDLITHEGIEPSASALTSKVAPETTPSAKTGLDGSSEGPLPMRQDIFNQVPAPPSPKPLPKSSNPVPQIFPSPFQQPRPTLAQSSFSWMLGPDQRKSSFVSASPFPSDVRTARGKAGFLFGENGEAKKSSETAKEKPGNADDVEQEAITLGTLKGVKEDK